MKKLFVHLTVSLGIFLLLNIIALVVIGYYGKQVALTEKNAPNLVYLGPKHFQYYMCNTTKYNVPDNRQFAEFHFVYSYKIDSSYNAPAEKDTMYFVYIYSIENYFQTMKLIWSPFHSQAILAEPE